MKTPALMFVLFWPVLLLAQDARLEPPAPIERQLQTKEIQGAEFDADDACLTFNVGSDRYYYPLALHMGAAANYGVLAELRSADWVTLRLDPKPEVPGGGRRVLSFVFHYGHLHP